MTRLADFLSGALFAAFLCSAAADAQRVELRCQPTLQPEVRCDPTALRYNRAPVGCHQS